MNYTIGDRIITAWTEKSSDSSTNDVVWVLIDNYNTGLRKEALSPNEWSDSIRNLFEIENCVSSQFRIFVESHYSRTFPEVAEALSNGVYG